MYTILTPKAGSPGHLWSYQTQHMCRCLANTHHTSCRTQTTPHTSERGNGISCTRPTPARSISLTTRHFLLLVKCGRRVVCRLGSGTHRPIRTHLSVWQWHQLHATDACAQHQPRDAPPCLIETSGRHIICGRGSGLHATDACAQHQPRDSPPASARDVRRPPLRRLQPRQRHQLHTTDACVLFDCASPPPSSAREERPPRFNPAGPSSSQG